MRFNSVRTGNYAQSAQAVTRASDQIFDAAMSGKPDFTKISKAAIQGRSAERRAVTQAEGNVAKAGLEAFTYAKRTKNAVETEKAIADIKRPAKRMAGMVAGLGAISGAALMNKNIKEDKAERAKFRAEQQAINDRTLQMQEELKTESKKNRQLIESFMKPNSGSSDATAPASTESSTTKESRSSQPTTLSSKSAWNALGSTLKFAEGTYRKGDQAYNTGYGYNMFSDLSKHPDTVFNNTSAAAGAYQFMPKTWNRVSSHLGLTDFSAESQEKAGEQLAKWRGVDTTKQFTTRDGFTEAMNKMAPEWASLPTLAGKSYYDGDGVNNAKPLDELISFYESQVGYKLK